MDPPFDPRDPSIEDFIHHHPLINYNVQGVLALLPHSSPSAGQQQQQHLRGIAPAAALHSNSVVNMHATAPFSRRAAAAADGESIKLGGGDLSWTADGKKIKVNGKPFHLKGVSWFGFEL